MISSPTNDDGAKRNRQTEERLPISRTKHEKRVRLLLLFIAIDRERGRGVCVLF